MSDGKAKVIKWLTYLAIAFVMILLIIVVVDYIVSTLCSCNNSCVGCIYGFHPWYCTTPLLSIGLMLLFVIVALYVLTYSRTVIE